MRMTDGVLDIRFMLFRVVLHGCMNKKIGVLSWERNRLLILKVEKVCSDDYLVFLISKDYNISNAKDAGFET